MWEIIQCPAIHREQEPRHRGKKMRVCMEKKDAVEQMLAKDRSLDASTLQPYES